MKTVIEKAFIDIKYFPVRNLITNLKKWWRKNSRNFPWRKTNDPYHILIAEIFLHRTKAEQVLPVYEKFIQKYPTIKSILSMFKF